MSKIKNARQGEKSPGIKAGAAGLQVDLSVPAAIGCHVSDVLFCPNTYHVLFTSFTKWDGFNAPVFNGLDNYTRLFSNPAFVISVRNLIAWSLIGIFLHVGFGGIGGPYPVP